MRIKLVCVGKLKEKYLKDACSEYAKRISGFGKLDIIEIQDEKDDRHDALLIEAGKILKAIKDNEYVISMEIKGDMLSSEQLAGKLSTLAVMGRPDVTFIIGGSTGLHESVSARSDFKLSFSKMTFPHQLARVMLLEQIYRAFKINHGGNYHK
ncbi:MAG: 23S rRNA (pseudouridine(1915)-N(3))-methyltransferase RlmH [Clostridia bacterium]|nr:23S rRNA (pseudouridine(1915)-N(3))-methyltransferase RlmH [Clostridia bacterium]